VIDNKNIFVNESISLSCILIYRENYVMTQSCLKFMYKFIFKSDTSNEKFTGKLSTSRTTKS